VRGALRGAGRWLVAAAVLAAACAQPPPPPLEMDATPIAIAPPPKPLPVAAVVRPGSFARSRVNPDGIAENFRDVLLEARVFAQVLDAFPPSGPPVWELQLAGSDYGEPDAYSLELSVVVLRQQKLLATYTTKQAVRQAPGSRRQLTIGPPELSALAERAIRDLVRQVAADYERLSRS
jgi:hypothetical protein